MSKRILLLILSVLMIASSLVVVPVSAAIHETTLIRVVADVTDPSPGDTINFTIIMGPVSDLGTMQMVLDIPEGFTYVENSGRLADNLEETMGFDVISWTESSRMINGGALYDYNSDAETIIGYFQCTADGGFKNTGLVGLDELEFFSCETWEDHTERFRVVPSIARVRIDYKVPDVDIKIPAPEIYEPIDITNIKFPTVLYDEDGLATIEIPINDVIGNKVFYVDETGIVVDFKATVSIDGAEYELKRPIVLKNYSDLLFNIEPLTIYSCAKKLTVLSGDSLKNADVIGDDEAITTADAMVVNALTKNAEAL